MKACGILSAILTLVSPSPRYEPAGSRRAVSVRQTACEVGVQTILELLIQYVPQKVIEKY